MTVDDDTDPLGQLWKTTLRWVLTPAAWCVGLVVSRAIALLASKMWGVVDQEVLAVIESAEPHDRYIMGPMVAASMLFITIPGPIYATTKMAPSNKRLAAGAAGVLTSAGALVWGWMVYRCGHPWSEILTYAIAGIVMSITYAVAIGKDES